MPLQPTIESPDPEDNWQPDDNGRSKAGQSSRAQSDLGQMLPPSRPQRQATGSDAGPSSQARPRSTGTPMDRGPQGGAPIPLTPAPKGMRMAARCISSSSLTPGLGQGCTPTVRGSESRPSNGHFARRGSARKSKPSRDPNDEVDSTPEQEMSPHDCMRFNLREEMAALRRQRAHETIYSEEKYPIDKVLAWKIYDEDCIELLIRWEDRAEETWEPEEIIQEDAESLVYAFWKEQHGRQRSTGLDNYHVFKILEARATKDPRKPEFRAQWVGYRSWKQFTTWEPYDKIYRDAKAQYIEFIHGEKMW